MTYPESAGEGGLVPRSGYGEMKLLRFLGGGDTRRE